ncbi:hypothetical protein JCM8115_005145 [Rhodotorula mucilaginosa]|nr:hypothetical protein B0A53_00135 [Rhodotorula sp. CCFEE 5036]
MSTIKSENWDMDWLMPQAPVRKSVSHSTSSSSPPSSVHSQARRTPSTSPEAAIAVKKEEEDEAPLPRPSQSKKRSLAPEREDDDKEKVQRRGKVKRSQSPSVAIKFEPDSDEEDKLKVLRREEEEKKFKWPRPAAMEGVNLFRLEDLDERGAPFVVPPGSELDAGLQSMLSQADGGFKRCDLPGPQQETNWLLSSTRPARYVFDRATFNSGGNLACRAAGQAILSLSGVYPAEDHHHIAVWVLLPKRASGEQEGETWFPFGVYRTYWNGAAEPGEFDGLLLSPDEKEPLRDGWQKQEEVLGAHDFYTKGTLSEYGRWMYENTLIDKRAGHTEIGVDAVPTKEVERQEIRAATRFCLSRNRGLNVGYTVYVYDGPITEEEIGDAVERRALRRRAERVGMWNTRGKKVYPLTEEEIGDSEEKAWVMREAIRLEMVGKKKNEEDVDPEQSGQPKKKKAKKSTAGKKKSTAGKNKVANRGGNPPRRRSTTPQAPAQRADRARRSVGMRNESDEGESDSDDGTDYEDDWQE